MFYRILNLPTLPQELVNGILDAVANQNRVSVPAHQKDPRYLDWSVRRLTKTNGDCVPSVTATRYTLDDECNRWLIANVHAAPKRQYAYLYTGVSDSMGPHVDHDRDEVWLYLIESGGSRVETVWYQEKDQPILRPDMQGSTTYMDCARCDYRELKELARFETPLHTWVSINSLVIHSVEGLTANRLSIQITV